MSKLGHGRRRASLGKPLTGMTDQETAAHLRSWVAKGGHGQFAWPTDACGYDQHMKFVHHLKFVHHRNQHWYGEGVLRFNLFVLDYADLIDPLAKLI